MSDLVRVALDDESGLPRARQVAHTAAGLLGLGAQDQTRVATAVSEVARAVLAAGGGALHLGLEEDALVWRSCSARALAVPDVPAVVARLVDALEATPQGLRLVKRLPAGAVPTARRLASVRRQLEGESQDALAVLRTQNLELAQTLVALREREAELVLLNEELAETNRGVLALYGELEDSAEQVRTAQRQVFTELEAALRPPPPQVPGAELAVRYLPAQIESPTGGDLYDWLLLADGALHVAVVDVMGHGVRGTRDALEVTHALRTLSREGHELGHLVAQTDQLLGSGDVVATVVLARYDPATGDVELAGGGHPPALVVRADGSTEYVEAPGRPIGYPLSGSDGTSSARLAPGDTILLYTDGLIERQRDIVLGLEELLAAPRSAAGLPLDALLDHVLAEVGSGTALPDDTLLLGLRRAAHPEAAEEVPASLQGLPVLRLSLEGDLRRVRDARRSLADACTAWGVARAVRDSGEIILSELVTNALLHAGGGPVDVRLVRRPAGLRLEVGDGSPRAAFAADPGQDAESGRGLLIVQSLASSWGISADATSKTVWVNLDEDPAVVG